MANSYQGSPPIWILDTASATAITADELRIDRIVWETGASGVQGDECLILDNHGNTIVDLFAAGAYQDVIRCFPRFFNVRGLVLSTLSHGKVYIYMQ